MRIAMWSGPRNISTALMRAWENRPDAWVVDEPLYAHYLTQVTVAHPGVDEVIQHHDGDWERVVAGADRPDSPRPRRLLPEAHGPPLAAAPARRVGLQPHQRFLIRHPAEMLPSLAAKMGLPVLRDTGLPQQVEIFRDVRARTGETPVVLDSEDVLKDPRGVLGRFCARVGVAFDERDAALAAGTAGDRRHLGQVLVRRGGELDRLRAVVAAAAPGGAGAGAAARRMPPVLRGAGGAPAARLIPMLQTFDPKNRDLIVNINGRLVHRDEAGVSPFDSVVQGGDAVWEGLRLYNGRIFRLHEHLDRLRSSALALAFAEIPIARRRSSSEIRRTLAANQHARRRAHPPDAHPRREDHQRHGPAAEPVRADADRAGRAQAAGLRQRRPHADHQQRSAGSPPDCLDPKIHHNNLLQSILAKIEANAAGADDALMLDTRGFVAETNATHVFLVDRGDVRDAAAPSPAPKGSRAPSCSSCAAQHGIPHEERDLSLTEVYRADEVFCTGTMGELAAVTKIDGRTIGDGRVGPMTQRLTRAVPRADGARGRGGRVRAGPRCSAC